MKVFTFETAITRRFKFSSGTMHRHRGGGGGVYRVLVGRPEGKRPLGRHGCRWEDNFKLDLREIRIGSELHSTGSGYGPLTGFCEHGDEPSSFIKKAGYFSLAE